MIYLDNAATTFPKPGCVYDAVDSVQRTIAVNVGRGSYRAAKEAMKIVDETKLLLASLVCTVPGRIVFTPSATIAANEIILGLEWSDYKNVYVTPFEHNAIVRPLHIQHEKYGFTIRMIPFDRETHELDTDELKRQFAVAPPDYVFINAVSNVTGTIIPVDEIAKLSKEYGALVIVDGSQSLGLIETDLSKSLIDFLIFAGHKNLCSSWGIGGFICNCDHPLHPVLAGGTGSDSLNPEMSGGIPAAFEFASPNIIAIASLNASIKWLGEVGIDTIRTRKDELMSRLISGLSELGATLYLPSDLSRHTSVLSFNIPGYEAGEVGMILNEDFDIAVRTGYHCVPFVHEFLGTLETKGTVRVSPGFFNTEAEIDTFIRAVKDISEG